MGLKNLQLPSEMLKFPGGEVKLHGLNLQDVTLLIRLHGPAISAIFERVQKSVEDAGEDSEKFDLSAILTELSNEVTEVIPQAIVLSAREPDALDEAGQLPFPAQLEAIEKIARVTFAAEGGVKNFAETVIRVVTGMTGTLAALTAREDQSPSENGSAPSLAA